MMVQCCVCKRIRQGDAWTDASEAENGREVSHGYCPACAEAAFAEIRRAGSALAPKPHAAFTAG